MLKRMMFGRSRATPFRDRLAAGDLLAQAVAPLAGPDPVVLALPRGGVPVGRRVADALGAPLDVLVVRKLGVPGHEELALGAIASGGVLVVDQVVAREIGADEALVRRLVEREAPELARREARFRGDRSPVPVAGRTAVVVDDGLATGSSMLAALRAVRAMEPARLVAAVPVAPEETLERVRRVADDVACLLTPSPFGAVGRWYEDFHQVSDEEVRVLLAAGPHGG